MKSFIGSRDFTIAPNECETALAATDTFINHRFAGKKTDISCIYTLERQANQNFFSSFPPPSLERRAKVRGAFSLNS